MTSFFDGPQARFLGVAVFMLGLAYGIIKWVGRTLREQLGPGMIRDAEPFTKAMVDNVPQALVRQAIERGLVTPAQLAGMSPMERQFVLASLGEKLAPAMNGAEFGLAAVPANGKMCVHCPLCGEQLVLPAFAPFVAHCERCGARSAVREDEGGRYVINVVRRPEGAVPRGPSPR